MGNYLAISSRSLFIAYILPSILCYLWGYQAVLRLFFVGARSFCDPRTAAARHGPPCPPVRAAQLWAVTVLTLPYRARCCGTYCCRAASSCVQHTLAKRTYVKLFHWVGRLGRSMYGVQSSKEGQKKACYIHTCPTGRWTPTSVSPTGFFIGSNGGLNL